ncbi:MULTISPECIES: hypothetical protein [unclassified Streptomyces]|uniref:hypothetical protein n=1 Tax=unclassified Streptomyces TaxID=2593676 RepID=UPI0011CD8941|nr:MULTISPECIES: hypothetical protein [unclassified Streptomyces]TXS66388.1 hypothetical protein EAO69_29895 [Streptomyces sp. me109]
MRHCTRVQVRWFQGHIGHELDETADDLAGLALRRAGGRIAPASARKEEARIPRSLDSGGGPLSIAA